MNSHSVDDIAVAHTPPGGWTEWPAPILAGCEAPLVDGAPDLRGLWRSIEVFVDGLPQPDHGAVGQVQRIEQAGDRLVVTSGGIIHDMRCDGTLERGVHDVAEFDKVTDIHVVATYENGVHVLRPQGMAIEVKRWRDGDHLLWQYLSFTARLQRIEPNDMGRSADSNSR
jgi:hypothetical protein